MWAVILYFFVYICGNYAEKQQMSEVDAFRYEFIVLEKTLWDTVIHSSSNTIKNDQTSEIEITRNFKEFGDSLAAQMPRDISDGLDVLENVWIWARTYGSLRSIYVIYENFRRFQKLQIDDGRVASPTQAWIDLAETILKDGKNSIPDSLDQSFDFVYNKNLFNEALKEIVFSNSGKSSPNQVMYTLYKSVAVTQLKGYMLMQWAYMIKDILKMGNYSEVVVNRRATYERRALLIAESARKAMKNAARDLWTRDPREHIKDTTYTELTELLQAYIENEVDMHSNKECWQNCGYYDHARSKNCYQNLFCNKQKRCKGKIIQCKYVAADFNVCQAPSGSGRRYDYIEYDNGKIYGQKKGGCNRGTTRVTSWWRYLFWHCSYCLCLCDEEGRDSDRYFNLREVVSNVKENYVVTGLKFVKRNRVIHLQISEGKLGPFGTINSTTLRWKPTENYFITDRAIKSGQDYHTMSWEKRDMDLDDLDAPSNYLLTGVRFRVIGTHLNLEVKVTQFNFTTGLLQKEKSYWHSKDNVIGRSKLSLRDPDVPTRGINPNVIDSRSDQYVEFTHTDFERDAGQTTVPFIDLQSVVPEIPVPLSGAGIYHKGQIHFGGFVAPKVLTYDFAKHLNVVFPSDIDTISH